MLGRKIRRSAVLGVAVAGACAVLAACSPVQMGSAAIVGNQRITVATLDTQVSNWKAAAGKYGSAVQITSAQAPTQVLSWMIRFSIMNQVAAAHGISVTQAQASAGLTSIYSQASSDGFSSGPELLVASGIPPQLFNQAGRWNAQVTLYEMKVSSNENDFTAAECKAAKSLNIQVSPQFGRFDYATSTFGVVAVPDTLSRPGGTPSPADTEGLTPAAC